MFYWFTTTSCTIVGIFYDLQRAGVSADCALGLCLLPICLFLFGLQGPSKGPDNGPCGCQKIFPAERSSRRVSERHLWWRRQRAFPASFQLGYKELLLCCSAEFLFKSCLGCPEASQRHNIALLVFQAESTGARPIKHPFVSVCSSSLFSLFIMVLLPWAFMFSYNPPNLNYPPFSPHESDFVDTPHTSPSQVNNFGCAVGLRSLFRWSNMWHFGCGLLFSNALWMHSRFSPSLHSQGLLAGCYKGSTAGTRGLIICHGPCAATRRHWTCIVHTGVSTRFSVNHQSGGVFFGFLGSLTFPLTGGHSRLVS